MSGLVKSDGSHESQRQEDIWTDKIRNASKWVLDGCSDFEFGRNYFKFKDSTGKTIIVKVTSK